MFNNYKCLKQIIAGKRYKLFIANSITKKRKGLAGILKLPKFCGMIFPYSAEESGRSFTMKNVHLKLRIIFLDKNMNIIYQEIGKPGQRKSIVCEKPSMYVIEIPA